MNTIDNTGLKFGRLTALKYIETRNKRRYWEFLCECGKKVTIPVAQVRSGNTQSCGCLFIDMLKSRTKVNAISNHPLYHTWNKMIYRCENTKSKDYATYGAKGVKVCPRWRNNFWFFVEDMGEKPSKKHSLDRIDPRGNYSPENCRWATSITQGNNKRENLYLTYKGEVLSLMEHCRKYNLNYDRVKQRIYLGWRVEDAFEKKSRREQ